MLAGSSPRSVASLGRPKGRHKLTKVEERDIRNLLRSKFGDDINYVIALILLRSASGELLNSSRKLAGSSPRFVASLGCPFDARS